MTTHIYRYRATQPAFTTAQLQKRVHASATISDAAGGMTVDISCDDSRLTDLDEEMLGKGYSRQSTDPGVTPPSELRLANGTILTAASPADGEFLKRSGATIIGASGGSSFDQRDVLVYDHFILGSQTSERVGLMGWLINVQGTGSDLLVAGEVGHPGILDFGVGTTTAGRCNLWIGDATNLNFLLNATQNQIDLEWLVRFNAAALSSTNMERFFVGFGDTFDATSGTEMTNGIYAEFNPALSSNWRLVTSSAGTKTRTTSSGSNPTSATWYRVGIRMTFPGGVPTANLLINGTVVASHTTNIPSVGLGVGIRMDSNGNTEARFQTDYVICSQITSKET